MTDNISRLDLADTGFSHDAPELDELAFLAGRGVLVAPIMVVPAREEEEFYRNASLVPQLNGIFSPVDPADPDEDDIHDFAPAAQELLLGNYLLDEVVDWFYDTVEGLPGRLRVRRPGSPGILADGPRAALLALKSIWAADWSVDGLLDRLRTTRSFSLAARPVLLHPADEAAGEKLSGEIRKLLGRNARVHVTASNAVSRLSPTS